MEKSIPSASVTYARHGASTKANPLGMRPMQERAFEKRGEKYLLVTQQAKRLVTEGDGKRDGSPDTALIDGVRRFAMDVRVWDINCTRMENLFHRLFALARLNTTSNDRFGHPVHPEECFLVPLFVIDEAVARIKDGNTTGYLYDPSAAKLVKAG